MANFSTTELAEVATGRYHLEEDIDWCSLFADVSTVSNLRNYSWAHNTELDFILVPYFAMCGAVVGNKSVIDCGTAISGRTNQYLLMCGNPGSGKSSGFHKSVMQPSEMIERESGAGVVSQDVSKSALLAALQKQTKEQQRFLILASDEMGLWLKGEVKDFKEWEKKRALYNSCFSGTNISVERMRGGKPDKINILNPHLSIIGMTQPTPLYDWIKIVNSHNDGLLDRYLIWVVKETEKKIISKDDIELPENWPKDAIQVVTRYHILNPNKKYNIPRKYFEKVRDMENMKTRCRIKEWDDYLDVLSLGNETEAIMLRRNVQTAPLVRFSELVFRFAIGLHVGLFGFRHCLSNLPLDNIPETVDEYVLEFAIVAVQRCVRQSQHFRDMSNKSAKAYGSKVKSGSIRTKMLSPMDCETNSKGNFNPLEPGCSSDTIFESSENSCSSQFPIETLERQPESSNYFDLSNDQELRATIAFPSRFVVPKAMYRFSRKLQSGKIRKTFSNISSIQCGRGYLGKILKLKTNPNAKRSLQVLFRAPYSKVDKALLHQIGIKTKEEYQKLLNSEIGGPTCPLRKAVENGNNRWTDFVNICEKNKPNFQDVPDFEQTIN